MKKVLAIVVLGLLWSNMAAAKHNHNLSQCFVKKVNKPEFKKFERKSFKEMTDFPGLSKKNNSSGIVIPVLNSSFGIFRTTPVHKFLEISFVYNVLQVVTETKNGEVKNYKTKYNATSGADNYIFYKPAKYRYASDASKDGFERYTGNMVRNIKEGTIELKLIEFGPPGEVQNFSAFLQCKKNHLKHYKSSRQKKEKNNDNNVYLILLSIIGLINLVGLIYLIRRKK
jgi:hypothetical protein